MLKVNWKNDDGDSIMNIFPIEESSIFSTYNDLQSSSSNIKMVIQLRESDESIRTWLKSKDIVRELKRKPAER